MVSFIYLFSLTTSSRNDSLFCWLVPCLCLYFCFGFMPLFLYTSHYLHSCHNRSGTGAAISIVCEEEEKGSYKGSPTSPRWESGQQELVYNNHITLIWVSYITQKPEPALYCKLPLSDLLIWPYMTPYMSPYMTMAAAPNRAGRWPWRFVLFCGMPFSL